MLQLSVGGERFDLDVVALKAVRGSRCGVAAAAGAAAFDVGAALRGVEEGHAIVRAACLVDDRDSNLPPKPRLPSPSDGSQHRGGM